MSNSDEIINKMKHEETLRRLYVKNRLLGFLAKHNKLWENLAFYCAFAVNIIILISYQQNDELIDEEAVKKGIDVDKDCVNEDDGELYKCKWDDDNYIDIVEEFRKWEPRILNNVDWPANNVINILAYIL